MTHLLTMSGKRFDLLAGIVLLCCAGTAVAQPEVTMEFDSEFGQFGFYAPSFPANQNPPQGFSGPTGVTFQAADRIIVVDRGNLKLQSCDLVGECFWIGNDGTGFGRNQPGIFDLPHGVEVNSQGLIAVADEDNHWVQLCNDTAGCIFSGDSGSQVALPSSSLGQWAFPQDVAVDSMDRVYGMDTGNDRIQILDADNLNFTKTFMRSGSSLGRLNGARGISIDKDDMVIIADTGNNRIQICDIDANCTAFGSQGSGVGRFRDPVGVEVDDLGRIWVADTGNNRIQVCDYEGACKAFGSPGTGEFEFDAPSDVAVHPSGLVAVVDTGNHRIQLFRTEAAFAINAGMNDVWFNPDTPGQGFFITAFPVIKSVFLANFTFDTFPAVPPNQAIFASDDQRWVTGFGGFSGARAVLEAELTEGGLLNSKTPVPVQTPGYGTYIVTFTDCMNGIVEYDFPSLGLSGVIPITRIAPDNAALCLALQNQ
jgi:DNA-binding beta-propeller fold protein YncE